MNGFFSRARKAVVAFVGAFIAALLTAMQTGTVFQTEHGFGINMAAVGVAAVTAFGAALAVFSARNSYTATFARGGRVNEHGRTRPVDEGGDTQRL